MFHKVSWISGVLIIASMLGPAWAVEQVAQLTPNPASSSFGWSVAVSGDYIVVGAPDDQELDPGNQHGAAYIFKREDAGWVQQVKIFASELGFIENFGYSVDMDGDRLVVGSPNLDPLGARHGSAYIFHRGKSGWTEEVRLTTGGPPNQADAFGHSVTIEGDVVVVGATELGRVYAYRRNGTMWVEEAVLAGADTVLGDVFGFAVSLSEMRIVVGAPYADSPAQDAGAVYPFRWTGGKWAQDAKLTPADAAAGDGFGFAVSLSRDRLLIGAPGDDYVGGIGSAYVFARNPSGWVEQAKVTRADAGSFGQSVAVHSELAMVGAPSDDDAGFLAGSVSVFQCEGGQWTGVQKFLGIKGQRLGRSVSIDSNYAVSNSHVYAVPYLPRCIPTVTTWGVLVLAFTLMAAGTILLRRRIVLATCISVLGMTCSVSAFEPNFNAAHLPRRQLHR